MKTKKNTASLTRLLAPALLGLLLCAVCLAGSAWAWFTATQSAAVASIQTGRFQADVSVIEGGQQLTANQDGSTYSLTAGKTYTVFLDCTQSTAKGFVKISLGEKAYVTESISAGGSCTFQIVPDTDITLVIESHWGEPQENGTAVVKNGDTLSLSGTPVQDPAEAGTPANGQPAGTEPGASQEAEGTGAAGSSEAPSGTEPAEAAGTTEPETTPETGTAEASDSEADDPGARSTDAPETTKPQEAASDTAA